MVLPICCRERRSGVACMGEGYRDLQIVGPDGDGERRVVDQLAMVVLLLGKKGGMVTLPQTNKSP